MREDGSRGPAAIWPEVYLFASSSSAMVLLTASAGLALLGAAMLIGLVDGREPESMRWFEGWVVMAMALACAFGYRHAMSGAAIVTVGPYGVRDTRLGHDWVPWSAVTRVSEGWHNGARHIFLYLRPAFIDTMPMSPARLQAYRVVADGPVYAISAAGLRGGIKALEGAIAGGFARAGGPTSGSA